MAVKSVHIAEPAIQDSKLIVLGDEHQHLRVGRAGIGEPVEVFNGRGWVWKARVDSSERHQTILGILEKREVEKPKPDLILGLSLIKNDSFELALEKAVEVGVTRIVPMIASRSNVTLRQGRAGRPDRWMRVLVEAAKQSKRYHLPILDSPIPFAETLTISASTKIVFAERGVGPLESALAGEPVLCLVGPEGGWTDEELAAARDKGFMSVGLGDGILRTETAAIVGAALIRYEFHRNL